MLRAVARHATCADLPALRDELSERGRVLVVDVLGPGLTEDADLPFGLPLPALVVLLFLRFSGSFPSLGWHPAVSPRFPTKRQPPPAASPIPTCPAARPWRSPSASSARSRLPRSPRRCASRLPGSPTIASAGARPRRRACRASATRPHSCTDG